MDSSVPQDLYDICNLSTEETELGAKPNKAPDSSIFGAATVKAKVRVSRTIMDGTSLADLIDEREIKEVLHLTEADIDAQIAYLPGRSL